MRSCCVWLAKLASTQTIAMGFPWKDALLRKILCPEPRSVVKDGVRHLFEFALQVFANYFELLPIGTTLILNGDMPLRDQHNKVQQALSMKLTHGTYQFAVSPVMTPGRSCTVRR